MELLELFKRQLASSKSTASKSTLKNYLSDVRHFINWFENTTNRKFEARMLSNDIVRLYRESLGGSFSDNNIIPNTQLSVSSMKRHLSSLRKFVSVLQQQNIIQHNPFQEFEAEITPQPTDYWHLKTFKDYLLSGTSSKMTVKNYVADISSFARWYEEAVLPGLNQPLASAQGFYLITQGVVEDYRNRLIQVQNAAPRTVNRKLSSLRKYLEFAVKKGFISPQELNIDPVQRLLDNEQEKNQPQIKLEEIVVATEPRRYSKIPPVRLFQKLVIFPYLALEDQTSDIIAGIISGKPVTGIYTLPKKITAQLGLKSALRAQNLSIDSLLGVRNIEKEFYAPDRISLVGVPVHKRLYHHVKHTRPNWYKKYHNYQFVHYAHFALLIVFASGVGVALYTNLVSQNQRQASAAPTAPPRILSFQGRLLDNLDNPITATTNLRFAIYNDSTASGGALLWQEVNGVAPDQDGIFSILLGQGTSIPTTVFSDNSSIYLGVTVSSTPELAPRQRIATVGFATNAEFLQGLPPTTQAGITSFTNVVLALDSSGNLTLSDSSPTNHTFQVTNGSFRLSGQTLNLTSNSGSNGDVILSPDGLGKIDVQKPLINTTTMGNIVSGGVEVNDKFGVLATESAQAAFRVNNNTGGGDIFTASSSGTPRFTVQNDGTLVSAVYTGQNGILYGGFNTGILAQTTTSTPSLCLQSGASNPTWGTCGGANFWRINLGTISPINDTLDLLVGANTTASAKFRFLNVNTGTPVASVSANSGNRATYISGDGSIGTTERQTLTLGNSSTFNTTGNILINPNGVGMVGIGRTNPLAAFDLFSSSGTQAAASISANTSNATLIVDNKGTGDLFTASSSGVPQFVIRPNGDVIVGPDGEGKITVGVIDPWLIQNQKTSGIQSLSYQTMGASGADHIFLNQSTELSRLTMAGQLQLLITGSSGGLVIGGDTHIYRGDTNRLDVASGDSFNIVNGNFQTGGVTRIDSSGNATFTTLNLSGGCTGCTAGAPSPFQAVLGAIVPTNETYDLLVGSTSSNSAEFAVRGIASGTNPTASVSATTGGNSGNGIVIAGDGSVQSFNRNTLTLGGGTSGNIVIDAGSNLITLSDNTSITGDLTLTGGDITGAGGAILDIGEQNAGDFTFNGDLVLPEDGIIGLSASTVRFVFDSTPATDEIDVLGGNLDLNTNLILQIGNAGTNFTTGGGLELAGTLDANGQVDLGDGGDTITLNGSSITLTGFNSCILTTSGAGALGCTSNAIVGSKWTQNDSLGYLTPNNNTLDILVGGTTTASAKFAVLNIAGSQTPVASVSATSAQNRPGLYMSGAGTLSSVNKGTLTLGGNDTGNIVLDAGSNILGLADNTIQLTGTAPIISATTTNANVQLNANGAGTLTLNSGATGNIQFFSSSNTLSSAGALTIAGDATVNGTTIQLGNGSAGTIQTTSNQNLTLSAGSGTLNLNTVSNGAVTTGNGLTTLGGNLTVSGATTTFNNASPVITTGTNTNLVISPSGSGRLGVNATTPLASIDLRANSVGGGTIAVASVSGTTSFASLIVDNRGLGDIFTASTGGVPKFTIRNNGSLVSSHYRTAGGIFYADGLGNFTQTTAGALNECLKSAAGGAPTWGACGSGGDSFWNLTAGVLHPGNSTVDLAIGGTSSSSAKFLFANVNAGTPTLKIFNEAKTQSLNLFHDGTDGNILSTTGTLNLGQGGGSLYLETDIVNDTSNNSGFVRISDKLLVQDAQGVNALAVFNNTGSGDIITASASGATRFTVKNDGNASSSAGFTINGAGALQSTNNHTLTIGGNTTGFINIDSNTGLINLLDNTTISQNLTIGGTTGITFSTTGGINLAGGTISDSSDGVDINDDLDVANNINLSTGNLAFSSTGGITLTGGTLSDATDGVDIADALEVSGLITANGGLTVPNGQATTLSSFTSNGGILFTNGSGVIAQVTAGSGTQCLLGGTTPTFGSCSAGGTDSPFQVLQGAIVPLNSTVDTLLGGQASNSAAFKVTGQGNPFRGTLVGASVSANTTFAGLVVDNRVGDLFAASSSAVPQFVIRNNGSVGIGTVVPTTKLDVIGSALISQNLSIGGTTGITFSTTGGINLAGGTIIDSSDGVDINDDLDVANNINLSTGNLAFSSTGGITLTGGTISDATDGVDINDDLDVSGTINLSTGNLAFSSTGGITLNGGTILDGIDGVDINDDLDVANSINLSTGNLAFSSTGGITLAGGTITDGTDEVDINDALAVNGVLQIGGTSATTYSRLGTGTTNHSLDASDDLLISDDLEVNGDSFFDGNITIAGTCTGCGGGSGTWVLDTTNKIHTPINNTVDITVGGTSTASAQFAVLGLAAGTNPTASISAVAAANRPGLYMAGTGTLSSVNKGTLTIGSSDTGNIIIDSGSGLITLSDNTTLSQNLTIGGSTGITFSTTGGVNLAGGTIVDSSDEVDINDALAVNGVLQVGGTSGTTYSRLGAATAGGANIGASNDLLISGALEVDDVLYLHGNSILSSADLEALSLSNDDVSVVGCLNVGSATECTTQGNVQLSGAVAAAGVLQGGFGTLTTYSRLGNGTTGHSLGAANDLLIGDDLEVDGDAFFDGNITIAGTCTGCGGGGANFWQYDTTTGIVANGNLTTDLLLGSTSTASAKFAFKNVAGSLTPVASISATTASGGNGSGIVLSGDGSIQSVRNNTLTIGGDSTGNISLMPKNGSGSVYIGTNPARGAGIINIPYNIAIAARNSANNADITIATVLDDPADSGQSVILGSSNVDIRIQEQIKLRNNKGLRGLNAAGSGYVDLIKLNASNEIVLGTGTGDPTRTLGNLIANLDFSVGGEVEIGTANAPTIPSNKTPTLRLYSTLGTSAAASISARNTTDPTLLLTKDGGQNDIFVASYSGIVVAALDYTGNFYASGYNGPRADFSEYVKKSNPDESFEAGQLVCADGNGVTKCSAQTDNKLVGVISDNALITGNSAYKNDPGYVLVGMVGQLGVWVTGDVKPGEALTYSETPGYATAAKSEGNIIGFTQEGNEGIQKRVATVIQPTYYNPYTAFQNEGVFNSLTLGFSNGVYKITDSIGNTIDRTTAFSRLIVADFNAGLAKIRNLTVDTFASVTSNLGNATASTFALTTDTMTIGGKNIREFIIETVQNAGFSTRIVSPIASEIKTNVISPLADNSSVQINLNSDSVEVKNSNSNETVARIDDEGNATFSGELIARTVQTENSTSSNLQTGEATVAGTLRTSNLIADNIQGLDEKLATLAAQIGNNQTTNTPATGSSGFTNPDYLAVNTIQANFGIFEHGITSMGPITSNIITATDQLAVGANFSISNNAINTLGADLEIQSFRQGNISFQGGLIRMDTDGNMAINGNLNVNGEIDAVFGVFSGTLTTKALVTNIISPLAGEDLSIRLTEDIASKSGKIKVENGKGQEVLSINNKGDIFASGAATLAKLNFNLVGEAEASSLTEATASGSAGFATLRSGQPEVTIKTPYVTSKSLIYITPFGNTNNKVLYLLRQVPQSEVEDGSFTVGVSGTPTTQNIQFNWLIVN